MLNKIKALSEALSEAFSDDSGHKSLMRWLCLFSFLTAVIISGVIIWAWISNDDKPIDPYLIVLVNTFLLPAFSGKLIQKFAEVKALAVGNPDSIKKPMK